MYSFVLYYNIEIYGLNAVSAYLLFIHYVSYKMFIFIFREPGPWLVERSPYLNAGGRGYNSGCDKPLLLVDQDLSCYYIKGLCVSVVDYLMLPYSTIICVTEAAWHHAWLQR